MIDYDDSIAEFEQEYDRGEFANLDDDPEAEARREARERQEDLDRQTARREASRRLSDVSFINAAGPIHRGRSTGLRSEAELLLAGVAQGYGHRAEPWLGPEGPLAFECVRDHRTTWYRELIDLWETDRKGYEAELRRRGLVR